MKIKNLVRSVWNKRGATAIEYVAITIAVVAIIIALSLPQGPLRTAFESAFNRVGNSVTNLSRIA